MGTPSHEIYFLYESSDVSEIDFFLRESNLQCNKDEPKPKIVVVREYLVRESSDALYESSDVSEIDDFCCTRVPVSSVRRLTANELHGQGSDMSMLLNANLRARVLKYGDLAKATYDDLDRHSGACRYAATASAACSPPLASPSIGYDIRLRGLRRRSMGRPHQQLDRARCRHRRRRGGAHQVPGDRRGRVRLQCHVHGVLDRLPLQLRVQATPAWV
jgi:hypothetical protein